MDYFARSELASIKNELRSIIRELESISNGVRNDFEGVGNDKCASCIDSTVRNYRNVLNKLNNMDLNAVTEQFARMHENQG